MLFVILILVVILVVPLLLFSGIGIIYQLSELLKQYAIFDHPFLTILKIYIISVVIYLIFNILKLVFEKRKNKCQIK